MADPNKIRPTLKALINHPHARPNTTPAPAKIRNVYHRIAREARERQYGERPWITLAAAATFTLNSPSSLVSLHSVASSATPLLTPLAVAELIREVGLKCISFNGIPRTINCLGAFKESLDINPWAKNLANQPTRGVSPENLPGVKQRGVDLWTSVYTPFHQKLYEKLGTSHPDLPVHILNSHYGPLLADPSDKDVPERKKLGYVGRNLTSVVAVACLRAQTGVGPQVLSHVYGLRKGIAQGLHEQEFAELGGQEGGADRRGIERLAGDEGCEWLLNSVDSIARAIGGNFAAWRQEAIADEDLDEGVVLDGEVDESRGLSEEEKNEGIARESKL
ncbi:hypothetical protein QBC35DRAFT_511875 [Podospora australis]|uniref:Dol-P-Man:Man(5)GlcNAc(2)-PP-Dol alpha-1,3-mannosyltransferase n=1 Tax=Podospora australis TaxID=1536484 RepID=A0AAN6X4V6_9PEZI|nr:hypothetical protein QBC35DRAFT_511875 [Podospora australis]